jgi:hypothetical protein
MYEFYNSKAFIVRCIATFMISHFIWAMSVYAAETDVAKLINDLQSDDVKWNADRAISELIRNKDDIFIELENALFSSDYQKRQLAAFVLIRKEYKTPNKMLIKVLIEALKDDDLPRGPTGSLFVYNAVNAARYLIENIDKVEGTRKEIAKKLDSKDWQQRFFCAYILGMTASEQNIEKSAPILISHLKDNELWFDACMSSAALHRFGKGVTLYLRRALPDADKQQKSIIELILLNLQKPPKSYKDFKLRSEMQTISNFHDPSIQYTRVDAPR